MPSRSSRWGSFVHGLLPTVSIDEIVRHLPGNLTLGRFSGVEELITDFFIEQGQPRCNRTDCELAEALPAEIAAKICGELQDKSTEDKPLLIGAYFAASLGKAGGISKLLESFITAGLKRFLIGDRLVRVDSESPNPEIKNVLADAQKAKSFTVIDQTISSASATEAALCEALTHALELGSDVAVVQKGRDSKSAQRWFSARGYYCELCGKTCPPLKRNDFLLGEAKDVELDIHGKTLKDCAAATISDVHGFILKQSSKEQRLVRLLDTLRLCDLGYVSLSRRIDELSSGERLKAVLAHFINSSVRETLFLLERPSAELHSHDVEVVFQICRRLVESGNTMLIGESSRTLAAKGDDVIELGVAVGEAIVLGKPQKSASGEKLRISSALVNGGRSIDLPLHRIVALFGESGSGKTQLMRGIVKGNKGKRKVLFLESEEKQERGTKVLASAAGFMHEIGEVFARLPLARREGLTAKHFSLDDSAGRCETCRGTGRRRESGVSLDDDDLCDVCVGLRFAPLVLAVTLNERSISNVLELTVSEAKLFFSAQPTLYSRLSLLQDLGLSAQRLSDFVANLPDSVQRRIRLAKFLFDARKKGTLLLLEHPLSGLSGEDLDRSFRAIREVADSGGSVIFSTNSSDVAAQCDYVAKLSRHSG